MAKYASDANLIKGAATAYKNYDNVAGMYSGLDKVTKAGTDMMGEAVKGYEAEQEKIKKEQEKAKKEQEAAKAKQDAIEKEWDNAADKVILSSGSLGDKLYNFTTDEVGEDLKKLYLEGVNEKDPKKRREAMRQLQAHSTWVQNHKQMNLDYAHMVKGKNADGSDNPGMSKYFTTNPKGMEEAHTMKQIMDQKYTHTSRDEETGDIIFHIPADDEKGYPAKTITSKEYNDMVIPRNYSITANTEKLQKSVNQSENLDEDVAKQSISNVIDKMSERDFVASMYDDVSGKNLNAMLNNSKTLDQEILGAIDASAWEVKKDGVLDPYERQNFIDAVTNPENNFFDLETSKQIMADQIFNGVKNRHTKHWKRENDKNNKNTGASGSQIIYGNTNLGDKSFVQQDDILDKATNNETIYTWGGERFDPDPENPGNYKLVDSVSGKEVVGENGEKVNGPIDAILRSKYFGLNERMNSRKLKYPTGIASVNNNEDGDGDLIPELPNNKEKDNTVPLPKARGLTSTGFDTEEGKSKIIGELEELYKPFGDFKYISELGNLLITSPDGSDSISVNMDRKFSNTGAQAKIQEFIKKHAKQTEEK